ncbi:pheA operon leader peptide PheL [Klebsiella pneumoniae]|nr:pheA operon leader peptide PheL [Klebsiella pneumoniae]MBD3701032.1 pheA operon leader peptide PheL [Klebsiella pneumoniae]MBD3708922.1 pheA operon leader peptide PheL [Klebsiella pneumoniae]
MKLVPFFFAFFFTFPLTGRQFVV